MVKNLPASAGDIGDTASIPGSGRSPGEGNGKPLQHSYLENPMDRGAWWATVLGVSQTEHAHTELEIKAQMEGFLPLPASQRFQTLLLQPRGNSFSGLRMSSASDQKFFCAVCSVFKCSFNEFVGEKVVSPSYSSTILTLPWSPQGKFLSLLRISPIFT